MRMTPAKDFLANIAMDIAIERLKKVCQDLIDMEELFKNLPDGSSVKQKRAKKMIDELTGELRIKALAATATLQVYKSYMEDKKKK